MSCLIKSGRNDELSRQQARAVWISVHAVVMEDEYESLCWLRHPEPDVEPHALKTFSSRTGGGRLRHDGPNAASSSEDHPSELEAQPLVLYARSRLWPGLDRPRGEWSRLQRSGGVPDVQCSRIQRSLQRERLSAAGGDRSLVATERPDAVRQPL